jgi:hypothetical protein
MPDHPLIRWETDGGSVLPADENGRARHGTIVDARSEPEADDRRAEDRGAGARNLRTHANHVRVREIDRGAPPPPQ